MSHNFNRVKTCLVLKHNVKFKKKKTFEIEIRKVQKKTLKLISNLFGGLVVHFDQLNRVVPANVFRPVNGVHPGRRFAGQNEILLAKNYALRRFVHVSHLT